VTTEIRAGGLAELLAHLTVSTAQALIICPLRTAGEIEAHDAEAVHTALRERYGAEVDLLHGALPETAKLAAMERFRSGQTRVLVATTVVEVGVDVPTVTLLAVLDADRFGLAQLHQLRGRLGRGALPGTCLLLHAPSADASRLAVLAQSDDGLAIAEADLAERGPGELLGTRQHGLFRLRIADLARDLDLLQRAHQGLRERRQPLPPELARWIPSDEGATAVAG